jgi:hypothetical protein
VNEFLSANAQARKDMEMSPPQPRGVFQSDLSTMDKFMNDNSDIKFRWYVLLLILGFAQVLCSAMLWAFHLLFNSPLKVQAQWHEKGNAVTKSMSRRSGGSGESSNANEDSFIMKLLFQITFMRSIEGLVVQKMVKNGQLDKIQFRRQPLAFMVYMVLSMVYLVMDVELLYYSLSFAMAVLGTFRNPLFLSFHLLGLIHVSESLQSVTTAIAHTGPPHTVGSRRSVADILLTKLLLFSKNRHHDHRAHFALDISVHSRHDQ